MIGAVYRSVSLPSFANIYPSVALDDGGYLDNSGNPLLKPSTAWNYDLGTSVYSDEIGLFTVDLFYKDISDLIYAMQGFYPFYPYPIAGAPADLLSRLPAKSYYDTTWTIGNKSRTLINGSIPMNDPSNAYLRGIEFSWQTHFWYLPGILSGLVLDFNLSLMSSNQLYPYFKALTNKFGSVDTLLYSTTGGALQNQPKAIYNVILGWDYKGFSARYSVRYQRLTLTSMDTQFGLENSYYDNVLLMDISLKQQIIGNLSIFANATNINGHIDNYYYNHPSYLTIPAGDLPTSQQTYGWAGQFGLTFSF
jgi:outer membrane receptor protein involved in Fe transport